MTRPALPPQIRVVVRDWLNANQIVLRGRDEERPDRHRLCHARSDYARAASGLPAGRARATCSSTPIATAITWAATPLCSASMGAQRCVPADEAPLIRAWDVRALWIDYAGQQAERFTVDGVLAPGADTTAGAIWIGR